MDFVEDKSLALQPFSSDMNQPAESGQGGYSSTLKQRENCFSWIHKIVEAILHCLYTLVVFHCLHNRSDMSGCVHTAPTDHFCAQVHIFHCVSGHVFRT